MLECWGQVMGDGERPYRKLGVDWGNPTEVREYRREWHRLRYPKVKESRKALRRKWSQANGLLPSDRVRAMREFARTEAKRRGVAPLVVYQEWDCLTPRERRDLLGAK
jgi:hypothetical protein